MWPFSFSSTPTMDFVLLTNDHFYISYSSDAVVKNKKYDQNNALLKQSPLLPSSSTCHCHDLITSSSYIVLCLNSCMNPLRVLFMNGGRMEWEMKRFWVPSYINASAAAVGYMKKELSQRQSSWFIGLLSFNCSPMILRYGPADRNSIFERTRWTFQQLCYWEL